MIGFARFSILAALVFCISHYLGETWAPMVSGLKDRGGAGVLLGTVAPALWVLLIPGGEGGHQRDASRIFSTRLSLCLVAALQPLAAYPTPGTQMAIGTMLLALCGLFAFHDVLQRAKVMGFRLSRSSTGEPSAPFDDGLPAVGPHDSGRRQAAHGVSAVLMLLVATLLVRCVHGYHYRSSLASLPFPGTQLLRVSREKADRYQWLVTTLRQEADTFVFGEHAVNSLYLWTGLQPPTALNPTFWPFLLTDREQQRIIAALESTLRTAVVRRPFQRELPPGPLRTYVQQHYQPSRVRKSTEVWLSKAESDGRIGVSLARRDGSGANP